MGRDEAGDDVSLVYLPDSTYVRAPVFGHAKYTIDFITRAVAGVPHPSYLVALTVFAQRCCEHLPRVPTKSQSCKVAGLARAVTMVRIEQVASDLLLFDPSPMRMRELHF